MSIRTRGTSRVLSVILVPILIGTGFHSVHAATSLSASVDPKKIAINQTVTLRLTILSDAQNIPQPELPPLVDFDVYSSGRNQNVRIVNGRVNTSVTYTYVLSPRKPGRFTIGPAKITIGRVEYKSEPEIITVIDAPAAPSQSTPPTVSEKVPPGRTSKHRIFITASLDKQTAYVNEPVAYIFRFYQGERLMANPEYSRPAFTGYWVEDLPPQRKYSTTVEGVSYDVTEIRTALFPTDAGEKTIGPATIKALVRGTRQNRRDPFSLFDNNLFFGPMDQSEEVRLSTESLRLTVLPLPPPPVGAASTGLVGRFTMTEQTDVRTANVGDPITVVIAVAGDGNIKSIPRPGYDSIPGFRSFSAGSSEDVATTDYRVHGRKTFDEVFIPQRPGTYRLPSFVLTYFDPDRKAYEILRTDSIEVNVTGGAPDFTIPSFRLNADQLSDLAADVRFLKTDGRGLRRAQPPGLFGIAFWLGHVVPLAGLIGVVAFRRRQLSDAADPVGRRRRKAYRLAAAHLDGGDRKGPSPATNAANEMVARALHQYFSDRYNCAAQGLTRAEMQSRLAGNDVPESTQTEFLTLLELCDRTRYAPGAADGQAGDILTRARMVLKSLEGLAA